MMQTILRLNPAPLSLERPPQQRFIGCCRHFATLAVALLRRQGVPARVRAGFASYFQPEAHVDHWIAEFRRDGDDSWIRIDPQIGEDWLRERDPRLTPLELTRTGFLSGGEAWQACRSGELDPDRFASGGGRGAGEVRGSVFLDLAALNKVVVLPWDAWGPMPASYRTETDEQFDRLVDEIATATISGLLAELQGLYESSDNRVPDEGFD